MHCGVGLVPFERQEKILLFGWQGMQMDDCVTGSRALQSENRDKPDD